MWTNGVFYTINQSSKTSHKTINQVFRTPYGWWQFHGYPENNSFQKIKSRASADVLRQGRRLSRLSEVISLKSSTTVACVCVKENINSFSPKEKDILHSSFSIGESLTPIGTKITP